MADNVGITAGAGTTIATDEIGGVHYQRVKLSASAADSAADLSKAEDAAAVSGDHGIPVLAVRRDTAAVGSDLDGDYSTLNVNASGRLYTSTAVDTALPAGTNNIGDVDVLTEPASVTDDAAYTITSDKVKIIGGTFRTTVDAVDSGDGGAFHMTARRALHTSIRKESDGSELGGANSAPLWASVHNIETGDGDTVLDETANAVKVMIVDSAGTAVTPGTEYTEGDTDTTIAGVPVLWEDAADTLRAVSAAKPLPVNIVAGGGSGGTSMTDDAAFTVGTTAITPVGGTYKSVRDSVDDNDGGAFAMTIKRAQYVALESPLGDSVIDDTNDAVKVVNATAANLNAQVVGPAAHDAAVSGNPILNGAEARTSLGTAVAEGDVVRLAASRYGMLFVSALAPSHASSNGTPITATTTSIIAAPSAGNHLRVLRIHMSNGGSTSTWVAVRDGAAGTQHYRTFLPQGGFLSLDLNQSGPLDLTTATRLDIVLSAAGSVEYEIDYFTVAD
jgi:hypothetical protein